ncbi:hypothetical protein HK100_002081, partial [Physocladia obscura]
TSGSVQRTCHTILTVFPLIAVVPAFGVCIPDGASAELNAWIEFGLLFFVGIPTIFLDATFAFAFFTYTRSLAEELEADASWKLALIAQYGLRSSTVSVFVMTLYTSALITHLMFPTLPAIPWIVYTVLLSLKEVAVFALGGSVVAMKIALVVKLDVYDLTTYDDAHVIIIGIGKQIPYPNAVRKSTNCAAGSLKINHKLRIGSKNAIFWPWLRDTVVVCAEGLMCSIMSGASGTCQILQAGLPIESNEIDSVDSDVASTSDGDIATATDYLDVVTVTVVEGNAVPRNSRRGALCSGPKRLKCSEGLVCRWAGPAPLPYFSSDATSGDICKV